MLANDNNIIRTIGPIPETYSLITKKRLFILINNIPVCTWSEKKFFKFTQTENLSYIFK